jgi:predicted CxxxxCH...CXXCH cytochrome family protein
VVQEARALFDRGALLLDVRTPGEFDSGHVHGAVNIPVQSLAQRLGELPSTDQPIVVYCHSGGRSASAASMLRQAGWTDVRDVGPMPHW